MPAWFGWGRATALTFLAFPLGLRAERQYHCLPSLPRGISQEKLPSLSVIIPARNEEHNLPALLNSLAALDYPGTYEVVVVDDHSTDGSATLARAFGARVLQLSGGLPPGWLGKPHACFQGALAARGEWLLFTDADTLYDSHGPARAVSWAIENGWEGLSLFLHQQTCGWSDRIALTAAYAGLFAGLQPDSGMLNGQFILIRRQAYLCSGGHKQVRDQALEDMALGRHLQRLGYQVPILHGEDAGRVRMYHSQKQLFQGMTRLGSDTLRFRGAYALLPVLLISAVLSPLVVLAGVLSGRVKAHWLAATWAAASLSMLPWARRFGDRRWALLAPLGSLYVLAAALFGLGSRVLGLGLKWKGRKV
jgi:hypothetical protein